MTVAGAIDREADGASRNITVRATSADGSFTDQVFTITINDVDEFDTGAVTDSNAAANTVAENAAIGTAVGLTGLASDADATATITYTLDDRRGRAVRHPRHHRRRDGQRGTRLRDGHQPLGHHPRHQLGRLLLDAELFRSR